MASAASRMSIRLSPVLQGLALAACCMLAAGSTWAELRALTPEQQQAAEAKKQQAAAQAEQEKRDLAASMEAVSQRWRKRADERGWDVHPQIQPQAKPGDSTKGVPQHQVRSEKSGTAPPSEDAKNPAEKGK